MITIIFCHPWHGSFNKAILDCIVGKLIAEQREYTVIDLYKDEFNPVFTEEELSVYNSGIALDPMILKYQATIRMTSEIIFIFPNWWNTLPAILKGFFDKVLLKDFAFNYVGGFNALLDIPKTFVITTSEKPSSNFAFTIEKCFIEDMLNAVGIKNGHWLSCTGTSKGSDESRQEFLDKVSSMI